jgi:hypothetical protein
MYACDCCCGSNCWVGWCCTGDGTIIFGS